MQKKRFLTSVKRQYEALPYPPRNPQDEKRRLIQTTPDNLAVVNHYCFHGRKDFRAGFRCLVAGGGTGDSLIYIAEQLRDFDAELVYLDFSNASREVAEERARVRQLTNIRWITDSIMSIPDLNIGSFDYINCIGVLHHLESAEEGLKALNSVLKDDGAMSIMLYGKYGRLAVYEMQSLLRKVLPVKASMKHRIQLTRQLLEELPETNRFKRELHHWRDEISNTELGDSGLYDLLLHSRDRCFDVAELYDLAGSDKLHIQGFPANPGLYDPLGLLPEGEIKAYVQNLSLKQQQILAEQIACDIRKHEFYLTREKNSVASFDDEANAIVLYWSLYGKAKELAQNLMLGQTLSVRNASGDVLVSFWGSEINKAMLKRMDGKISIARVCKEVSKEIPGISRKEAKSELIKLFSHLHQKRLAYLVHHDMYPDCLPDYGVDLSRYGQV